MALFKNSWFDSISTATFDIYDVSSNYCPCLHCASSRFICWTSRLIPSTWSTGLAFICIAISDSWFVECAIYRSLDSSLHDRYPLARFRPFCSFKDCQNVRSQENTSSKKCDGSIGIWYSRFYHWSYLRCDTY